MPTILSSENLSKLCGNDIILHNYVKHSEENDFILFLWKTVYHTLNGIKNKIKTSVENIVLVIARLYWHNKFGRKEHMANYYTRTMMYDNNNKSKCLRLLGVLYGWGQQSTRPSGYTINHDRTNRYQIYVLILSGVWIYTEAYII